jgi:hypothetical protein
VGHVASARDIRGLYPCRAEWRRWPVQQGVSRAESPPAHPLPGTYGLDVQVEAALLEGSPSPNRWRARKLLCWLARLPFFALTTKQTAIAPLASGIATLDLVGGHPRRLHVPQRRVVTSPSSIQKLEKARSAR